MHSKTYIAAGLAVLALAGGCGGDTYVQQGTTSISKGQELTDLQRALTDGAVTQAEYDELRAKILRRPG